MLVAITVICNGLPGTRRPLGNKYHKRAARESQSLKERSSFIYPIVISSASFSSLTASGTGRWRTSAMCRIVRRSGSSSCWPLSGWRRCWSVWRRSPAGRTTASGIECCVSTCALSASKLAIRYVYRDRWSSSEGHPANPIVECVTRGQEWMNFPNCDNA